MIRVQKDVLHETKGYKVECDEDLIELRFTCSPGDSTATSARLRPSKILLCTTSTRPETAFALNTTATFALP